MRPTKYDAEALAPLVRESRTMSEVLRRLGLKETGGNFRLISARVRQAGLDASHLGYKTIAQRCAAIPAADLARLVQESTSVAQVLEQLHFRPAGRSHHELVKRIRELALDTSHFRGSAWSRGETKRSHPAIARAALRVSRSNDEVFIENSPVHGGVRLTHRLLALGWPYRCAWCDLVVWRGRPLVLHVDHINGINNDNRFSNLRFLCPNCHSQTETYSNNRRPRFDVV